MRCDFNVPMEGGTVRDRSRIEAHVPTLLRLKEAGCRVMILSHLGRPKGYDETLSLRIVLGDVESLLGCPVRWLGDVREGLGEGLGEGEVGLFENVRFHEGETRGDDDWARAISLCGDLFVGDAFSVAHRGHSSVSGVAKYLPSVGGDLLSRELAALEGVLGEGREGTVAVVGGSKISTKLPLLEGLLEKVETLVLGGAMAHTFLLMRGCGLGKSLVEEGMMDDARGIEEKARSLGVDLVLPEDVVVEGPLGVRVCAVGEIGENERALDVGPLTLERLGRSMEIADRIVWNGPLGLFEDERFCGGTMGFVALLERATRRGCVTVGGGGDTVAALKVCGVSLDGGDTLGYVSLAGGAFLEYLEGRRLPGVEVLRGDEETKGDEYVGT